MIRRWMVWEKLDKSGGIRELSSKAVEGGGDNLDRYAILLRECGNAGDYCGGKRVHEKLLQDGLFGKYLGNLLVEMYGKCGRVEEAWEVFDRIGRKNVFSWNLMAGAYVQNGYDRLAIQLYRRMCLEGVEIDEFTVLAVLGACSSLAALQSGKLIHENIRGSRIVRHTLVGGSLVSMYGKCGSVSSAKEVFDELWNRTTVTWNAMLAAYSQNSLSREALVLFRFMQQAGMERDCVTFVTVLNACAGLGSLAEAQQVREMVGCCGLEGDVNVGNTIVNMYGKCRSWIDARRFFDGMAARKNVVSWTAMISAYAQNGKHREALEVFEAIDVKEPDAVVFVSVLDSCSSLCDLEAGREIHRRARKLEGDLSVALGNSLLQMYGRCGAVEEATAVFRKEMRWKDSQSWGLLMAAFAQGGDGEEALEAYGEMLVEGVRPNEFTMTNVLDACSHLGLASRARGFFVWMLDDHGLGASVEHVGCIVDLLGRLGRLDEAQDLVEEDHTTDAIMLLILLSACKMHGDVQRGMAVASRLQASMDDTGSASYVLVANSMTRYHYS